MQGVGFRPFVSRIADYIGIVGSVANKGSYVEIYAQGNSEQCEKFLIALEKEAPERSSILKVDCRDTQKKDYRKFDIIESEKETGDIFVSPDIATCDKCKHELFDKNDRRYLHPFINCTACGPRLTILDSMPYDRERTSMGEFPMCKQCEYEYTHAETRRYDAQPVCCNDCGPQVYILGKDTVGREAITYTREAIMNGKIIAVKGIGGFHLCCDACNDSAVKRLRTLKNRPIKPFAVMMKDIDCAKRECKVLPEQEEVLDGYQKPIILLKKREKSSLCDSIAPGNPTVGVMLPYAPLQMLLFDYDDGIKMTDCLVMTSGNVSGAPICRDDEDAIKEISEFCDIILSHNRKIRLRADDSVMDFFEGKPYMIRRSRGYAPLPIMLSAKYNGQVLAIGGELKNTFCISKNDLFYLSPYVGDMEDIRTVNALRESITRMEELLEATPTAVACDMHPIYNTVAVAQELGLPVIKVQHHYAHIVSCMAENDYKKPVIGVSFDGTGYGTDGTIWGGEILKSDYNGFERIGKITPFVQVGGDLSAKEGWRITASMVDEIYKDDALSIIKKTGICDESQFNIIKTMSTRMINSVKSTSAGRLFDGVSALLNIKRASTFEGEASTSLQFKAEEYMKKHSVDINSDCNTKQKIGELLQKDEDSFTMCTDKLVKYIVDGLNAGDDVGKLAFEFHSMLADIITEACEFARELSEINVCALSGGVFQNRLLLEMCAYRIRGKNFELLLHSLVPPNDGGIALGQAVVAMNMIDKRKGE